MFCVTEAQLVWMLRLRGVPLFLPFQLRTEVVTRVAVQVLVQQCSGAGELQRECGSGCGFFFVSKLLRDGDSGAFSSTCLSLVEALLHLRLLYPVLLEAFNYSMEDIDRKGQEFSGYVKDVVNGVADGFRDGRQRMMAWLYGHGWS
ncbi:hypothetical protein F0562_019479 [Nyssa sinensis]|uniref:Uncharacterized protein n=1 Tax=Nyssa sinensis TaxID=561372 RepID=A0A5J5BPU5_9ASTE|nr:hypothetical protein F0562_019479 [Nyssa sinensis]